MNHPIQPIVKDHQGIIRFKKNEIVEYLLDNGGIDLNHLARLDFSDEDRMQFAQLIGYSVSGFGDLSYVSNEVYDTAYKMTITGKSEQEARIHTLQETLEEVRTHVKQACVQLFKVHPSDLQP